MAILFRYVFLPVFFLCTGKVLLAQNDAPSPPLIRESMRENPDLAFKQIRRTLQAALADGRDYQAAVCYGQLGELYYFQAAYLQALDNFYRAEALLRKQKQLPELAAIWIKIGETKFHNKQYPSSLEAFEQGLVLYKSVDAEEGIADALAHIGQVHVYQPFRIKNPTVITVLFDLPRHTIPLLRHRIHFWKDNQLFFYNIVV